MKKGFTLIELLIVVAIIAILAAIAVPNFLEAQTRAKVSRVVSDMRTLNVGIETYKIDTSRYPINGIFRDGRRPDGSLTPGPTYNRHVIDPVLMTTPISYIQSEQPTLDLFQQHLAVPGATKSQYDQWILGRMVYYSYDDPARRASAGANIFGLYRFASAGPDQGIYNSQLPPEGTMSSRLISPKYRVYDATNGTVSAGDIWRLPKGEDAITRNFAQNN